MREKHLRDDINNNECHPPAGRISWSLTDVTIFGGKAALHLPRSVTAGWLETARSASIQLDDNTSSPNFGQSLPSALNRMPIFMPGVGVLNGETTA